jgi:hypothetical protein
VGNFFERGGASKGDLFELVKALVELWSFEMSPAWAGNRVEMGGDFLERAGAWAGDTVEMGGEFWEREGALDRDLVAFGEALTGVDRPVNPYDTLISHRTGPEVALSPEITQGIQY